MSHEPHFSFLFPSPAGTIHAQLQQKETKALLPSPLNPQLLNDRSNHVGLRYFVNKMADKTEVLNSKQFFLLPVS